MFINSSFIRVIFILFGFLLTSVSFANADSVLIKKHLRKITKTPEFRHYKNIDQLNKTAAYIQEVFEQYSDSVSTQNYTVNKLPYKNVIASFGPTNAKRIIVGAHYDVCGDQEGADDNASGVVGLLELARMLHGKELNYRIDLVAYSLEEPPFFRSKGMGSYIHAASLEKENAPVLGMISLEMIGFFKEEKHTQKYPLGILKLFYGSRGNYITMVKKFGAGSFVRKFSRKFKATKKIRTKKFSAPASLPGIDYSDHMNYWKFGYRAMMITDTSFYRNKNYHEATDTMETLDIPKMAQVIDAVYQSLVAL